MYTIKLLLKNENNSYAFFNKMFFIKFKIKNILISYAQKQIEKLEKDETYIQAKNEYIELMKDEENNKTDITEKTSIMNERVAHYGN